MRTTERNKLQRELTILQAKKRAGIGFNASDAERLSFLEEQLGNRQQSMPRTQRLTSDEPSSVLELPSEDLPEAELVDPSTLFDSLKDSESESPSLSQEDASLPSLRSAADDPNADAYSLDPPDPSSAEKEGQELLQSLFDDSATGSLDANGVLTKAEPPPLKKTTSNAKKASDAKPPSRVALGKLRVVSRPTNAEPSSGPARREPEQLPDIQFRGPRKANVHFLDGVCHRGLIRQPDVSSAIVKLDSLSNERHPVEELPTDKLKTIFLLLPRGASYPQKVGRPVKVLLIDGRVLAGTSPDYDTDCKAFTLLPTEDKGNIERVIIYRWGTKQIECGE